MSASPENNNRPSFNDLNENAQSLLLTALESYGQFLQSQPDSAAEVCEVLEFEEFDNSLYRAAILEGFRGKTEEVILFEEGQKSSFAQAAD